MSRRTTAIAASSIVLLCFAALYHDVLIKLVRDWYADENYSHGFLIVPVALYFVWERRQRLVETPPRPSSLGLLLVIASVGVLIAGILGAELFLTRISMLGVIAGTVVFLMGWAHLAALAFPLAFLLLMIPIPAIIFNQIAFPLQLLASRFGEAALMLAGIPVLREGNVITLASTSLEVAEACSGIRSLVSLLTLAIVYGYLADTRIWARVLLAVASVPVAIVANGVRVAGTGITANYLGLEAALGFFHTFSGWLVFIVAFLMLFVVHRVIVLIAPMKSDPKAAAPDSTQRVAATKNQVPSTKYVFVRTLVLSLSFVLGAVVIGRASRMEPVPARESFATFPMLIGDWRGENAPRFDQQVMVVLGVDEYINRRYEAADGRAVGLYIGYYQSQRQGDTMHSPLNCLPGSGWEPVKRERIDLAVPTEDGARRVEVNRIVVEKGLDREVVLYWYQSHGRVVASEYWGKVYTVLDAIRLNRTDAAMVRLVSPVVGPGPDAEEAAAGRVTELAQAIFPVLGRYLPE